jgi:hypothetical protein
VPTILVLTANKSSPENQLQLGLEVRNIRGALGLHSNFSVLHETQASPSDLISRLVMDRPEILHFAGHGSGTEDGEAIILVRDDGRPAPLDPESLARIFTSLQHKPRLVVLNSCYSAAQADALLEFVDVVVGMSGRIRDGVARAFSAAFYTYLAESCPTFDAFTLTHVGMVSSGYDGSQFVLRERNPGVSARGLVYFGRPELMVRFVCDKNGKPEYGDDEHYSIELFLRGVDQRVDSVTYQICHDSFRKKDRFYEIRRSESANFLDDEFRTKGDLTIRATAWSRDRGIGIESTVGQALRRYYGRKPTAIIRRAIEGLEQN